MPINNENSDNMGSIRVFERRGPSIKSIMDRWYDILISSEVITDRDEQLNKLLFNTLFKTTLRNTSPSMMMDITHYWNQMFNRVFDRMPIIIFYSCLMSGRHEMVLWCLSEYAEMSSFKKPSNMMRTIMREHQYDIVYRMSHDEEESDDLQRNIYTYSNGGYKGSRCIKLPSNTKPDAPIWRKRNYR